MKVQSVFALFTNIYYYIKDVKFQLIDRVNGKENLREKEGQWAYKLKTLDSTGLNGNDFFFVQNRRSRRT